MTRYTGESGFSGIPDQSAFDLRAQEQELQYISQSEAGMRSVCEQYAGLPHEA